MHNKVECPRFPDSFLLLPLPLPIRAPSQVPAAQGLKILKKKTPIRGKISRLEIESEMLMGIIVADQDKASAARIEECGVAGGWHENCGSLFKRWGPFGGPGELMTSA